MFTRSVIGPREGNVENIRSKLKPQPQHFLDPGRNFPMSYPWKITLLPRPIPARFAASETGSSNALIMYECCSYSELIDSVLQLPTPIRAHTRQCPTSQLGMIKKDTAASKDWVSQGWVVESPVTNARLGLDDSSRKM